MGVGFPVRRESPWPFAENQRSDRTRLLSSEERNFMRFITEALGKVQKRRKNRRTDPTKGRRGEKKLV